MDTCVIYNSVAGRHRARERMRRFKETWTGKVVFRPTERRGHGIDLAREAALEGFATVAAAGGDGTAHEVATGLLNSQRTDVTFAVIPLGSANDYAHSVRHQFGAMSLREPCGNLLDVGLARTPDGREFHFFESLGTGLSAQVTLESNAMPLVARAVALRLRGVSRPGADGRTDALQHLRKRAYSRDVAHPAGFRHAGKARGRLRTRA